MLLSLVLLLSILLLPLVVLLPLPLIVPTLDKMCVLACGFVATRQVSITVAWVGGGVGGWEVVEIVGGEEDSD